MSDDDLITQLYHNLEGKLGVIIKELDSRRDSTRTNERRIYYALTNIDNLQYYNTLLKVIYFIILGFYIIFGSWFWKKDYKNIGMWVYLILYIIFPFILKYIVRFFYNIRPNSVNRYDLLPLFNFTTDRPGDRWGRIDPRDTKISEELGLDNYFSLGTN
jgi:hypothetical protein